jgi:hypothetical protein
MRFRSKTNSRKHENLELRKQYKLDHPRCELYPILREEILLARRDQFASEAHHITGGLLGTPRWDLVCNLIHLSQVAHEWVERYAADGLAICCWAKLLREPCEFEPETFSRIMRVEFPGYFECLMPQFPIGVVAQQKVLEWMCENAKS